MIGSLLLVGLASRHRRGRLGIAAAIHITEFAGAKDLPLASSVSGDDVAVRRPLRS